MKYLILLILLSSVGYSQSLKIFDIDTTDFPTMRAKFWAFDEERKQITNLSTSDFELTENGEHRTITNISCPAPQPPIALSSVLTIDVSGSMKGYNIDAAKEAARSWINALPNSSECAITSFNSNNYFHQDFTKDKNKLLTAINNLISGGGTDFNAGLINKMAGALMVSKNAKNKKVIVFLTDGNPNFNPSISTIINEANSQKSIIYCVTLGMKCPYSLVEISNQTGGEYFENITTIEQAKQVYLQILQIEQGGGPCTLEWQSSSKCNPEKIVVELLNTQNNRLTKTTYQPPTSSFAKLEFEPYTIRIDNPIIGTSVSKTLKITARNSTFNVNNIVSSNPAFSISPTNFVLQQNESQNLTITYTAINNGYTFTKFSIENDICQKNFSATGGDIGVRPKTPTIKLTHPNGGETFVVGSDTLITWDGISASDTVSLDYSIDNGINWQNITNQATGLKYEWKKIPRPISYKCLIRVAQLASIKSSNDTVLIFTGHTGMLNNIAYSPDGSKVATASQDETARIWDANNGDLIRTLSGHTGSINDIAYNHDGSRVATSSEDGTARIWDTNTGDLLQLLTNLGNVYGIAYSHDGSKVGIVSGNGKAIIYDSNTSELLQTLLVKTGTVFGLAFSPDGSKVATAIGDGTGRIWDISSGGLLQTFSGHTASVYGIAYSPDGSSVATASRDNTAKIWDINTGYLLHTLIGHGTSYVWSIKYSPDGGRVATVGNDRTAKIWDVKTGELLQTLTGHSQAVLGIAYSPDGSKVATGSADSTARIWDIDVAPFQQDISDNVFSIVAPEATAIDVDMGKCLVNNSKDSVVNEFIQNIGTWKFEVDSIYFQGVDADAFSLVSGFPEYTIEANNSHFAEFRFTPSRIGVHNAEIVIETQSDTFTQSITGEGVNPQLEIMTEIIDFGVVEVGYENTIEQIAVLKNLSNQDIEITDVKQLGPDLQQFEILEGGGNFILGANAERQMKLRFKPKYGGRTSGQIGFEYNSFASPAIAQLFGTGIGGEIEIDDYSGYPGEEIDVAFRLTKINPEGLAELAKTFKAEVEVNGTLLYSSTGTIVKQEANFVSYEFNGNLGNTEILFKVPMKIGLGNSETSDIKLTKIELFDENGQLIDYDMEFNSGLFTLLGVCYEGGARLLDPNSTPVILSINPNPTGNMINIEFELIEKGGGELMIVDYEGKKVFSTLLKDTPGKVNLDLNSSGLPNGIYNVILQTPTINATQKLLINK